MPHSSRRFLSRSKPVPVRLTSYRSPQTTAHLAQAAPHQRRLAEAPLKPVPRQPRRPVLTTVSHMPALSPASLAQASISTDRLAVTLPVPPSINHQYATVNGRRVLSAAGRGYKMSAARQVLVTLARCAHRNDLLRTLRSDSLALAIHFYFTSPLRRDVDGGLKIAQDALCEALGINDNRIQEIHLYKHRDRANPRIEVSLQSTSAPDRTRSRH